MQIMQHCLMTETKNPLINISTIKQVGKSSGLKINSSKTIIFLVGSPKNTHIKFSDKKSIYMDVLVGQNIRHNFY